MHVSENYDLSDCSASECSNIGLMSELCYVLELNVKNPALCPTEK